MTRRPQRTRRGARRSGFSLVEVIVGITILSGALLGLAATASVGIKQTSRAREDTQYWGDAQQVMDSLLARGFGNVASGQTTVRGRGLKWEVGSSASAPQQIRLIVSRKGYQNRFKSVADTVIFYLAKSTPGA
jgi:prepilin-type N-terminal cleavage/methylation domain-containing protein